MKTFEEVTTQASTADIDHAWDNANNAGVAWYVNASAQGGVAKLCILHDDGTVGVAQADSIAAGSPTVINYLYPISMAIFRWTPNGTTPSTLISRLTPSPAR